jgi:hypothetical protein
VNQKRKQNSKVTEDSLASQESEESPASDDLWVSGKKWKDIGVRLQALGNRPPRRRTERLTKQENLEHYKWRLQWVEIEPTFPEVGERLASVLEKGRSSRLEQHN